MATFVLVHGGHRGGWCWKRVATQLRAARHDVYAPTLTGLADRAHLMTPAVDLDTHVTDVASLIEWEELEDVVLVGHSYGGMVVTGVVDRMPDRIGRVVYLDALLPEDGESALELAGPDVAEWARASADADGDGWILRRGRPEAWNLPPEELARMEPKVSDMPLRVMTQPLVLEHPAPDLPTLYVWCTASSDGLQRATQSSRERAKARAASLPAFAFATIDGVHDVMINDPDAVVDLLLRWSNAPVGQPE
jgi:pimeloyl-ACP methyl ester carboxylesterase